MAIKSSCMMFHYNFDSLAFGICFSCDVDWPSVVYQAGIALGELRSVADLYDFQAIATLFFIGIVSVTPTLINKSQTVNDA